MNIEEAIGLQMKEWGFSVEKIPESDVKGEKRPDFKVTCAGEIFLIEVKSREDDKNEVIEKKKTLEQGEIYGQHKPLVRKNTVSGIIRDACDQLINYGNQNFFRIVWLCAIGDVKDAQFEQFKAALYGKTQMFDLDGDSYHRPCYFYRDSDFFRYRNVLDAAIVSTLSQVELCFNPLSPKDTELQNSIFTAIFKDSICDPIKAEAEGYAYIVDSDVDRKDESAVMRYLREKYNAPKLQKIDLGWHSGSILL
ncbi:MAG: hypothetical protein K9K86_07160 [Pseudomonadales bacterium]|nr:hypothetical protein [Pseudomonadales bacterium]